jgi:hypothetical protein
MRKLFPILLASAALSTASAALPFVDHFASGAPVPEPATNILLVCGLLTVGGLAIFLGKKIG